MRGFGIAYLIAFIVEGVLSLGALWSDGLDAVSDRLSALLLILTVMVLVFALRRQMTPWLPYAVLSMGSLILCVVLLVAGIALIAAGVLPESLFEGEATTRTMVERAPWFRWVMIADGTLSIVAGTAALAFVLRAGNGAAPARVG